jgi:hypothetical protein
VVQWYCGMANRYKNRKFLMTPIMRDHSEGSVIDASEAHERFRREQW